MNLQFDQHKRLVLLAVPMILANITTPLLGLVDTAILGHLPTVEALAGASIGALVITQIYWLCNFLRMSVTGLSAQTLGKNSLSALGSEYAKALFQGVFLAISIAVLIIVLLPILTSITQTIADTDALTNGYIRDYILVRGWGAPAALLNFVVVGWLVGQQRTKSVLLIQVFGNILNIGLSLLFVLVFEWGVKGVAAATVVSEFTMALLGFWAATKPLPSFKVKRAWFSLAEISAIFSLNSAMFIRNIALQICVAFITFQGARLGAETAAVNAILMQFFVLISLGLDGIAYAVEALVGQAKGQRESGSIQQHTLRGLFWSSAFALCYTLFFIPFADDIAAMMTNKASLIQAVQPYLVLMIVMPIIAHWCFLFDGVFVGLSRANAMRDTMLLSALIGFFPTWWLLHEQGNWALWAAFLSFQAMRGISLGWIYFRMWQTDRLLD